MKSGHESIQGPINPEDHNRHLLNLLKGYRQSAAGQAIPGNNALVGDVDDRTQTSRSASESGGTMVAEDNSDNENASDSPLAVPSQPFMSVGPQYSQSREAEVKKAEEKADELIGTIYVGKYELLSHLGAGGMGVIYLGRQIFLDRLVAIKMLKSKTASAKARMRFHQEGKAASALNHPGIVAINDFGTDEEDRPYMVMEYVEGVTLSDIIRDRGKLRFDEALPVFLEILDALAVAHSRGVVHRDIKPSNIMLAMGIDGVVRVKLLDFGIAKLLDEDDHTIQNLTRTGEALGTPLYMSPEQIVSRKVDYRSDLYSFGCVMYVCLTGLPPFVGENKLSTMEMHVGSVPLPMSKMALGLDIPGELDDIALKLLAKTPEERYQSAEALRMALLGVAVHDGMLPQSVLTASRNVRERTVSQSLTMSESLSAMVPPPANSSELTMALTRQPADFSPPRPLPPKNTGMASPAVADDGTINGTVPGAIHGPLTEAQENSIEFPTGADFVAGFAGTFDSMTAPQISPRIEPGTGKGPLARTIPEETDSDNAQNRISVSNKPDSAQSHVARTGRVGNFETGQSTSKDALGGAELDKPDAPKSERSIEQALSEFSAISGGQVPDLPQEYIEQASSAVPPSQAEKQALPKVDAGIDKKKVRRPATAGNGQSRNSAGGRQAGNYLAAARSAALEASLGGTLGESEDEEGEEDEDDSESGAHELRRLALPVTLVLLTVAIAATIGLASFVLSSVKSEKPNSSPVPRETGGVRLNPSADEVLYTSLAAHPEQKEIRVEKKSELSTRCFVAIGKMPRLERLDLTETKFSPADLEYLRHSPVQELRLGGSSVSDAALAYLAEMPALTKLSLEYTTVSDRGMVSLFRSKSLKYLTLDRCSGISDKTLIALAESPSLRSNIETLGLEDCEITDVGVEAMSRLPKLWGLNLNHANFRPYLGSLVKLKSLGSLDLGRNALMDSDLAVLPRIQSLTVLDISNNNLTGNCRPYLERCRKLSMLFMAGFNVSPYEKDRLQKSLAKCTIKFDMTHGQAAGGDR